MNTLNTSMNNTEAKFREYLDNKKDDDFQTFRFRNESDNDIPYEDIDASAKKISLKP